MHIQLYTHMFFLLPGLAELGTAGGLQRAEDIAGLVAEVVLRPPVEAGAQPLGGAEVGGRGKDLDVAEVGAQRHQRAARELHLQKIDDNHNMFLVIIKERNHFY